ncbi:hypothetical protein RRG08_025716 [Elysia crispata]|uniref:Uncharacterized protein n=1 Tax=Elysia crispata TaxID=231223 RepID=A0AAE1AH67_9GAST|nr:hypothetical protein RRG08_025716 [Elysia crispata]
MGAFTLPQLLLLSGLIVQIATQSGPLNYGRISFRLAEFVNLVPRTTGSSTSYDLLISSRGRYLSSVGIIPDIGSKLDRLDVLLPDLVNEAPWPNLASGVPEQVLGRADPYIVVPYGSLEESPGGIAMQAVSDQPFSEITDTSGEWTYHKVQWVDMDKDGTLDALACRVRDSRNSGSIVSGGYDPAGQYGGYAGYDPAGQYGGNGGYDPAGQYGGNGGYDPAGQYGGNGGYDPAGQYGGNGGYDPAGQYGGNGGYDPAGQYGGNGGYDPAGQYGGNGGYDPAGQFAGNGGYDPAGQFAGNGGYDPAGQFAGNGGAGDGRYIPAGQSDENGILNLAAILGGNAAYDPAGQFGGNGGYDPAGQNGGNGGYNPAGHYGGYNPNAQSLSSGPISGELVWFSNPQDHRLDRPWNENFIANGPDVFFTHTTVKLSGSDAEVIITAEYYSRAFKIYWTENPNQDWSDTALIRSRDIDKPSPGSPYYLEVHDVNKDGKPDIILTTKDAVNGGIYVYEFPQDFRTEQFTKHLIAGGFSERKAQDKAGAPGAFDFLPAQDPSQKPSIVVAGADACDLSLLKPSNPSDPNNWQYTKSELLQTALSSIKNVKVADVDGDGRYEIFAPTSDDDFVYVWTV